MGLSSHAGKEEGWGTLFLYRFEKVEPTDYQDAYSIPSIEEIQDCLKDAVWFTSLDLKLGYWQVKMSKESKALTAFTVGPLSFYECKCMPFGLTNAPTMLQCLIERHASENSNLHDV